MNKANAKFAAIPGGSRNTVNGRYSFSLGSFASISSDFSGAISLANKACTPSGEGALAICANSVTVNGNEVLDLFSRRRELEESTGLTEKSLDVLAKANAELEKSVQARAERIEMVTKQLESFAEFQAKHKALKAKIEAVKELL